MVNQRNDSSSGQEDSLHKYEFLALCTGLSFRGRIQLSCKSVGGIARAVKHQSKYLFESSITNDELRLIDVTFCSAVVLQTY